MLSKITISKETKCQSKLIPNKSQVVWVKVFTSGKIKFCSTCKFNNQKYKIGIKLSADLYKANAYGLIA